MDALGDVADEANGPPRTLDHDQRATAIDRDI
jgi:hypothetical protein